MSCEEEYQARFRYSFRLEAGGRVTAEGSEMTQKEIQEFVNSSLGLMTGGCELCEHYDRLFCKKLGRPVKVGEGRCEYFTRRPSKGPPY